MAKWEDLNCEVRINNKPTQMGEKLIVVYPDKPAFVGIVVAMQYQPNTAWEHCGDRIRLLLEDVPGNVCTVFGDSDNGWGNVLYHAS